MGYLQFLADLDSLAEFVESDLQFIEQSLELEQLRELFFFFFDIQSPSSSMIKVSYFIHKKKEYKFPIMYIMLISIVNPL